jgi:hypothetical protein
VVGHGVCSNAGALPHFLQRFWTLSRLDAYGFTVIIKPLTLLPCMPPRLASTSESTRFLKQNPWQEPDDKIGSDDTLVWEPEGRAEQLGRCDAGPHD